MGMNNNRRYTRAITPYSNKYIAHFLFLLIGFFLFFRAILWYVDFHEGKILENGAEVIGEIYSFGGKTTHFRFMYQKQKYEVNVDRAINTIELGEKYFIKVDTNDPTEVVVEWWKPVIDSSFNKIRPTEIDLEKSFFSDNFDFSYTINNQIYTRVQKFPPNFENQKSSNFWVYYKRENPRIAYLMGFY